MPPVKSASILFADFKMFTNAYTDKQVLHKYLNLPQPDDKIQVSKKKNLSFLLKFQIGFIIVVM